MRSENKFEAEFFWLRENFSFTRSRSGGDLCPDAAKQKIA